MIVSNYLTRSAELKQHLHQLKAFCLKLLFYYLRRTFSLVIGLFNPVPRLALRDPQTFICIASSKLVFFLEFTLPYALLIQASFDREHHGRYPHRRYDSA